MLEVRSMPNWHRNRTNCVRTNPPIVSVHTNFFWSDVVRVVFVRQFVHLTTYRVIGGIGPPGWGSNAQKGLIQREFWGSRVYSNINWFWLQSGYDFTAVDDCEDLSHRLKIGPLPNAAVLSLFQMFFVRKTLQRTPSVG